MSFVYFVGMNYGVSSYVHNTSVARMYLVCIALTEFVHGGDYSEYALTTSY